MVPREFLVPFLISNIVAVVFLVAAWRWPRPTRWAAALVFLWAAVTNARIALATPEVYLESAMLTPVAIYRDFIVGWFSRYVQPMVLAIALGQLVIAALLAGPARSRWIGVAGALVFLAAIAPLGVGSAFPFSLTFGAALLVLHRRLRRADAAQAAVVAARDRQSPLAPFVPAFDVRERHEVIVHAPAALTMAAAEHVDLHALPVVSTIFRLRAWAMRSTPPPRRWPGGFVDEVRAIGWGELAHVPDRLLVMGAVSQPWHGDVTFRALPAADFASFDEPGVVKIAWTLEAEPVGETTTRLRTETRVVATDADARRRFLRYWFFARVGIVGIRWLMLPAVRREAERAFRARPTLSGRTA
jgi:hypothetical protein